MPITSASVDAQMLRWLQSHMTICHDSRDYNSSCKNISCQPWLLSDFTFFRREDTAVTWRCQGISRQQGQSQPLAVVSFSSPKRHKGKQARAWSRRLDKLFRQLYWRSRRGVSKVSSPNSIFLPIGQVELHCTSKTLRGFYTNLPILKETPKETAVLPVVIAVFECSD